MAGARVFGVSSHHDSVGIASKPEQTMRNMLLILWASCLLSILMMMPAKAEQVWHFPTPISASAFVTRHHIKFADEVALRTDGKLKIVVQPGGSLYKAADIFRAVRTGQVQIGSTGLFLHSAEEPIFEIVNLPFLVKDLEEAIKLIALSRPALEETLRRKNLKLIYRAIWNPQGLFSVKRLDSPDDVKGMKIRTYNYMTTRFVQLANGIPTKTEPSEIALAFSTAVIDGSLASGVTGVSQKLWDYIDYYYTMNCAFPTSSVVANLDAWNRLDAHTQNAVFEIATETEQAIWSEVATMEKTYNATMRQAGMNVEAIPPELVGFFEGIGRQMTSEWSLRAGTEGEAILHRLQGLR